MARDFRAVAVSAARAAADKQAEDAALLDIRKVSGLADFLLIATIDSPAQLDAVEEGVEKALKEEGLRAVRRDGGASRLWRVLDYGGLLVHLMHRDARVHYGLDKLFDGARKVAWEPRAAPARAAGRKRRG